MTKLNQDFTMWQGEDTVLRLPIKDAAGAATTLTGATITWRALASLGAAAVAIEKTTAEGITIVDIDDTDDGVEIAINKADTATLAVGNYYHECRVVDGTPDEQVVFVGKLYLKRSRTL
jgi:hypothetical protein